MGASGQSLLHQITTTGTLLRGVLQRHGNHYLVEDFAIVVQPPGEQTPTSIVTWTWSGGGCPPGSALASLPTPRRRRRAPRGKLNSPVPTLALDFEMQPTKPLLV